MYLDEVSPVSLVKPVVRQGVDVTLDQRRAERRQHISPALLPTVSRQSRAEPRR